MLIGQNVGPFHIEKELGSGAMGTVYQASFELKGKLTMVALKMVSLALLGDEKAKARFEREASILKQLRHPHIVRLLAWGKYRKTPFIAMEYVDGESMDRVMHRRERLSWEETLTYGKQLCDALQHAHERGIIHRDLKPSNLMINEAGTLKLTDFGIAKDTDVTALTAANSAIGTAAYMSPEQCRGDKTIGARSDLYSLGIVFYELITGRKPFTAENSMEMFLKHVNDIPIRPSKYIPDLPVWVDNLIMFLLEKKPETRPLDAITVKRMIEDIEQKILDQKSVGVEVATARKVDRKLGHGGANNEDREAALALRGKKKKKKKKAEEIDPSRRNKIIAIVAVLLVVAGLATWQLWPQSLAGAYAKIEAQKGDEQITELAKFIKKYGAKGGPEVDKARELFKNRLVEYGEEKLEKRFHSQFSKIQEGEDPDVHNSIKLALEFEESGEPKRAEENWKVAKDKSTEPMAENFTELGVASRFGLKWIAEKRLSEIQQIPAKMKLIEENITFDVFNESPRNYDASSPEGLAYRARWLEIFGDNFKARQEWDALISQSAKDPKQHDWWITAMARRKLLGKESEDAKPRIGRIQKQLADAEAAWNATKGNIKEQLPHHRKWFEIATLYEKDSDPEVRKIGEQARKLLKDNPKPGS